MKNFILVIILFYSSISFAQTDTIYLNEGWGKSTIADAYYYRLVNKQDDHYLVKDMYLKTNKLQMVAVCSSIDSLIKDGPCSFYSEDGQKLRAGNYVNNKETGKWTSWEKDGKDSLVIEFVSEREYKNILISGNFKTINDKYDVVYPYEIMPEFIGGESAMMKFIIDNVNYPRRERNRGITGTCYVTFVIEKDGSVGSVAVKKGVAGGPGCDKESVRVVRLMPNWKPGIQGGKIVRVQFTLPIKYSLRSNW